MISQIKHRSLSSYLKKHYSTPVQVSEILEKCPSTSRDAGALPSDWLKKISKTQIVKITRDVQQFFADFAKETHTVSDELSGFFAKPLNELSEKLSRTFNSNVRAEYLSQGSMGRAFKIEMDGKAYVLKTFHIDPYWEYESKHGKGAELAAGLFANKNSIHNQFTKCYLGRFARKSDNDGFILSKFLTLQNVRKNPRIKADTLRKISEYVQCGDTNRIIKNNKIGETFLEYGEIEVLTSIQNKKVRKINRLLCEAIDSIDEKAYDEILTKYKNAPELQTALSHIKKSLKLYYISGDMYGLTLGQMQFMEKKSLVTNAMTKMFLEDMIFLY